MFDILYRVFFSLIYSCLYIWFISKMLVSKTKKLYPSVIYVVFATSIFSSFLNTNQWNTWTYVVIILYALFFFKDNLLIRIFWSLIPMLVSMAVPGILLFLYSHLLKQDIDYLPLGKIKVMIALTFFLICWLILFLLYRRFSENISSIQLKSRIFMLVIMICCVLMVDLLFIAQNRYSLPDSFLFPGCILSLLIGLFTVITYDILTKQANKEQQHIFLEEQTKNLRLQMENLQENYKETLQLRHDIRAFLKDAKRDESIYKNNTYPKYLELLETQSYPSFSTGNIALDSILPVKINKIRSLGIEYRGVNIHYSGNEDIRILSICSLVSNMLDNAIEALLERKNYWDNPYIYLEFIYTSSGIIILCENPLFGINPKMNNSIFLSNKKKPYHGLGIMIMEKTVQDMGGHLQIKVANDLFSVFAFIPGNNDNLLD